MMAAVPPPYGSVGVINPSSSGSYTLTILKLT